MFTVSSVNVNGLRAAGPKGFTRWLSGTEADVVCLQEVRARPEDLPADLLDALTGQGWHLAVAPCETARGRSGVAVLSRAEPEAVRVGFGPGAGSAFAGAGRYLELDLPGVTVGSLYLPKGTAGTPRQQAKDRFLAVLGPHLRERAEKAAAEDREVLVCGDWNIAHTEADVRNWRANRRTSGFLPHERAWLDGLFERYVDVVRELHPGVDGPYSWWSYRGRAFDNDVGWRLDYQVATPGLAATARSAEVERPATYAERWSDHAPVTVRYDR